MVSVAGFGGGLSYASLETACQQRELLRIGFASGNPEIIALSVEGWQQMYKDEFAQQQKQAESPTETTATAETTSNPKCAGSNTATAWYKANCQQ